MRNKLQRGWTFTGLLSVLVVAGIFISVAFKLAPAYADFYTLKDIIEATVADRNQLSQPNRELVINLGKKMRINNLDLPEKFVVIERDKGTVHFDVNYEIRTPLFYNVDAVMTFKQRFTGQELE